MPRFEDFFFFFLAKTFFWPMTANNLRGFDGSIMPRFEDFFFFLASCVFCYFIVCVGKKGVCIWDEKLAIISTLYENTKSKRLQPKPSKVTTLNSTLPLSHLSFLVTTRMYL